MISVVTTAGCLAAALLSLYVLVVPRLVPAGPGRHRKPGPPSVMPHVVSGWLRDRREARAARQAVSARVVGDFFDDGADL